MCESSTSSKDRYPPRSCDTFAVLPTGTLDNCVVFGKNSDRPGDEVQEVIYVPATDHPQPSKVRCTYIEVKQVPHTYAVILSKPAWMWGAEMGANEHDVCIGNEAVWTVLNDDTDEIEKLLGMDLLRLGLERSKTALEAVHVIVALIDEYGMGGNCSDTLPNFTYHNSFLIADPEEVWILECAGTIWAAEKVTEGVRNISNELSIGTKIDLKSSNAEEFAIENGHWNSRRGVFNFKRAYDQNDCGIESSRYRAGKRLLRDLSKNGQFSATDMFTVLRDEPSGICMCPPDSFVSTGSQVSVLHKPGSGKPSCHWFTATPDPSQSVFKPFIFTQNVKFPDEVVSPIVGQSRKPDRRHELYKLHEKAVINVRRQKFAGSNLEKLEAKYVELVKEILSKGDEKQVADKLFYDTVKEECLMYN
ncbi:hypothetical protein JTE90_014497 [Oedothorax gibbosus]|uniref:Secernin-2 n=1 Tax=Oedothorax gibbosus TaxID=931172 RepID=A0AAV6VLG7_9ARAC|nr:hypothetical protein JTE90_014497 [Oedothorax gibbosus]